jgi:nitrite reductase/ring-hydroxylating ferredoxin subunit
VSETEEIAGVASEEQERVDLLVRVDELIAALSAHPDSAVKQQLDELLDGIDFVHRTALTRLMGAIQSMAGDAFINRLTADPAIRLLLMSYGLLAVDRRLQAEEALDAVRGHLHSHGIDVELADVVGSVVSVRISGPGTKDDQLVARALTDMDTALHAGLPGFQELTVDDGSKKGGDAVFLPATSLRRARKPVYRALGAYDAVAEGEVHAFNLDGESILVARVEDEVFAVKDYCGDTPLPLRYSTLEGSTLRCSWHGCLYDIRTGGRMEESARELERLHVMPVRVVNGVVEVATSTTEAA